MNLNKTVYFRLVNYSEGYKPNKTKLEVYQRNKEKQIFDMIRYLGKGGVGTVYQLSNDMVIKISENIDDLQDEVYTTLKLFGNNNINHPNKPIYYGEFLEEKYYGIVFPLFGTLNIEEIHEKKIKLDFNVTKNIVINIIYQLMSLNNCIHCDLKPSNVVLNDNFKPTIIDFALMKEIQNKKNTISTNYITTPESVLTLSSNKKLYDDNNLKNIDLSKHDIYGVGAIILTLYLNCTVWDLFYEYYVHYLKINKKSILKDYSIYIITYGYFKFNYNNKQQLINSYLYNLIDYIETNLPTVKERPFIDFEQFYDKFIYKYINHKLFNSNKMYKNFKNLLQNIYKFNSKDRIYYEDILNHQFFS